MAKWFVRFKYIAPYDYNTPMMYIPTEQTIIEAESADKAWEKWVTGKGAGFRENYKKIEVYENN